MTDMLCIFSFLTLIYNICLIFGISKLILQSFYFGFKVFLFILISRQLIFNAFEFILVIFNQSFWEPYFLIKFTY